MENPRNVIGATGFNGNQSSGSYYNDSRLKQQGGDGAANNYNENDLFEYDNSRSSTRGITGKVKDFLSLKTSNENNIGNGLYMEDGRRDFLDSLCVQINQTLIIPKAFYFFFFAAFGSLFPLMAIYFKQMAMSPVQVGILFGFRPFVEFLSAPFWAHVGERLRKGKLILLISLICWIGFTLGVGFIKPPVHSCLMHNETHIFFEKYQKGSQKVSGVSDNIVSGGYKVINKRSITGDFDYNDNYNGFNQDKNNYGGNSMNDLASIGLVLGKRQSPQENENKFKVVNITKIVKIKKTTTASTTTTPTTTKSNRKSKNKSKTTSSDNSNSNLEEIVFDTKSKSKQPNSKLEDAIEQMQNQVVTDSIKTTNKNQNDEEITADDVEVIVENQIDEVKDKILNDEAVTSSSKKPKKTTLSSSTSAATRPPETIQQPKPKPVEKTNYFDGSPLDNSKTRKNKIVFLNDSALKLVKPSLQTSIVYHKDDVQHIFIVFLIFILAGEFFSAPAITLADSCTLQYLGPARADLYGRQRMFGSLGWALAMFSVGILLDHSKAFTNHPCGKAGPDERNYSVCFAIYSVLMGCALIVATQFRFNYGEDEQIPLKSMAQSIKNQVKKVTNNKQFNPHELVNEPESDEEYSSQPNNTNMNSNVNKSAFVEISLDGNEETTIQKYIRLFHVCKTKRHASFLFVVWFMGIGVGMVFTFLFWHLQDLGGSPALYGIASVINHMSELMAYFFVHQIVHKFGHIKIFYAGLLGNAIRFCYVGLLTEPYWILPFEFIQGVTHALVWATATSYFAQSVPDELRNTAQGFLQGVHFGLGRGCGAVFGGLLISIFESKITFLVYGLLCLMTMFVYIAINRFIIDSTAKDNLNYAQNQFVNDEAGDAMDDGQNMPGNKIDTKNYYIAQSNASGGDNNSSSHLNKVTKSSFPIAPHGVPSVNPNWSKQFTSQKNF